ncbi:hypothetical protein MNBD_GAMMA22-123 [hydrothermal vent metagenome]|uniref:TolB protein, periplasmic protein involved in the tonb-independent uptake of group A colicins n=1 Tax=hydrothermal vent metagenome TaxID=652676 RepID=A0A3B1AQ30_9ZZZZ
MLQQLVYLKTQHQIKYILIVLSVMLVFYSASLNAAVSHSAMYQWYTIESMHFRIHYHTGEKQIAKKVANIAERVHGKLSNWIQWQPTDKTDLVVTDESDSANGFATPFPSNRSQLYISAPDSISSLEDYGSWLEMLISHEYLHILHLDKATKIATTWRSVFGRSPFFLFNTFPAASLPGWGIEGLATYIETDESRGVGRGQSSYFDMLMRLEVANGIKPVHQVNQPISSWPLGTTRYLYGVNYYQFIAQQYGAEKINALVDNYSATFLPFRINNNTEQVFDKNLVVLWQEFSGYLQKKHEAQIKAITDSGIKSGMQLTHDGYFDESLTTLEDGRLYYVSYDAQRNPALYLRYNNQTEKLMRVEKGTRLDVHPSAGLLLAQPSLCDNSMRLYDLYQMDLNTNELTRLTQCARYRSASWSPDGSQIIAAHNQLAKNELHLLDSNGTKIKTLWQAAQWQVISNIDWSPDGQSIVAALFHENNGWNIARFDLATNSWSFITNNGAIQNFPHYSFDGKSIYYSADRDGVYNVFKISLADYQVTQITNVLGAAFYAVESNSNGDIYYIGHNTQGMDLYQIAYKNQVSKNVSENAIANKSTAIQLPTAPTVNTTVASDYSPWSSLRPRWWAPIFAFDDDVAIAGFATSSSDILARHNYFTSIAYDSKNETPLGSIDYIYDRYWPILKLNFERSITILSGSDNTFARTKATDTTQIETVLPFLGLKQSISGHLVYGNETINDVRRASGVPKAREFTNKYLGAAIVYNSSKRHPRAISRNEGRQLSLAIEDSSAFDDSFYHGSVKTFDWREFVALGGAHVLALRVVSGRGDTRAKPFQLGGSNNSRFVPAIIDSTLLDSPFDLRSYNLRGYTSGLTALTGNNMNVISAEYRFPLFKLERSFMTPPIGLHELHATVFYDSGAAWNNTVSAPDKYYSSTGVEVTAITTFFFHARLNIVLGFARGLDDTLGEDKSYLRLGASF